jgi:two-component system, sensor histidine kinase and response regulator
MSHLQPPQKILLVDDVDDDLLAIEALLRRDGIELLMAQSGDTALELLLAHDVALALVDVQMPVMDGFELAERMRGSERTCHVPIIFVTAGTREPSRIFQGYDAGAVDFLFKPIEPRILRHKVHVFLELHRQRQILRETLRLNEELVAVVGHDLRSPLGAILMTADLLDESRDPLALQAAALLRSSGSRMRQIIDEILDLSRARLAGGIPVTPRPVDLAPLTRKVISELQTTHPTRTINLRTKGNTRGEWDGPRLEQVGSNLIGDALRHGALGTAVEVAIDGSARERVELSVHNAGHIPPELLRRVFEPFQQRGDQRTRAEGLGLGLYIVQQIAFAHGGDVTIDSTGAGGTTFRVTLPRHTPPP